MESGKRKDGRTLSIEVYEARKRSALTKFLPWLAGILIIGLTAALILTWSRSSGRKAEFLSQFRGTLAQTATQVQSFSENGTQEELMETTLSLIELHTMMKDGKKFVDPDIFYNYQLGGFDGIAKTLLSGIEYNGTVLCEGFLQDGVLSDPEKEYLVRLSEDLNTLHASLSKNGQTNRGLSIKKLNGYTHEFFSKYSDVLSLGLSN